MLASQTPEHTAPTELNDLCTAATASTECHSISSELESSTQTDRQTDDSID